MASEIAQVLVLVGAGVAAWLIYRRVKADPHAFSSENAQKSLSTLGFLALGLIVFISLCIFALNEHTRTSIDQRGVHDPSSKPDVVQSEPLVR